MAKFPFEKAVKENQPMPDGMSILDQRTFVLLSRIYTQFRAGLYTKEKAGQEKDKLWKEWKAEKDKKAFEDKLIRHHVIITRETERLRAEIMKSESVEERAALAVELVKAIDGMVYDDGGNDGSPY